LDQKSLYADSVKITDEDIHSPYFFKTETVTLLGYPLRLNLYNLAKEKIRSSYQVWLQQKSKKPGAANPRSQ